MPIATRRIGSIQTPKLDGSEAFYAPLWRPDLGGSTFKSLDRNAHICTVTSAVWGYQGRTFDGVDDYITIPDANALDITTLSIEAWISTTTIAAGQHNIVTKGSSVYHYRFELDGAYLALRWLNVGWVAHVDTALPMVINTWYHVVVTYDEINVKFYVNGVAGDAPAETTALLPNAEVLTIGAYMAGADPQLDWSGLIGEVKICNRALSLAEIRQIYLATKWRYS